MINIKYKKIIKKLSLKSHREFTHSARVSDLSYKIGRAIGLNNNELARLKIISLLHDIGKVTIPNSILNKKGKLTDDEYSVVKKHSQSGYDILIEYIKDEDFFISVLEHHERWDGDGYPKGKKGEEISLFARIIAVADTYDSITSNRPYRKKRSKKEALAEITFNIGKQFDPFIVKTSLEKVF